MFLRTTPNPSEHKNSNFHDSQKVHTLESMCACTTTEGIKTQQAPQTNVDPNIGMRAIPSNYNNSINRNKKI